ncbi:hypothetical protein VE03_02423 [Pseudogymnoascus sp. 23342-1-I1]|nr:hypothetical protein VE03_02423 [Pseudogymnoascus sp. 23342-1-I1]
MSGSRERGSRDQRERQRLDHADIPQRRDSIVRDQSGQSFPEQPPALPPKIHNTDEDHRDGPGATPSKSISATELRATKAAIEEFELKEPDCLDFKTTDPRIRDVETTDSPRNNPSRKSTLESERKGSVYEDRPVPPGVMLQEVQSECEILRARVLELQDDLKDAHDFIFSLQPRQQRFTETEAAAEFDTLCGSIEMLVVRKVGTALDEKALLKHDRYSPVTAKILMDLIPAPGIEAFKYTETDEYNVTAAIIRFLCNNIFDLDFYLPLGAQEREFMGSIERSMRNLEPGRDIRTIRTWRCETYAAIVNRPGFQQQCELRKNDLTDSITRMLRLLAPGSNRHTLKSSVHKDITEPAFALAHKMQLSVDRFTIGWSPLHNLRHDQRKKFDVGFSGDELVDLRTNIKPKDPLAMIDYVFDITPKLVFYRIKTDTYDEPKVLKKPRILVTVTEDGCREPDRHEVVDATVLGWLNDQLNLQHKRGNLYQRTARGIGQFI